MNSLMCRFVVICCGKQDVEKRQIKTEALGLSHCWNVMAITTMVNPRFGQNYRQAPLYFPRGEDWRGQFWYFEILSCCFLVPTQSVRIIPSTFLTFLFQCCINFVLYLIQ